MIDISEEIKLTKSEIRSAIQDTTNSAKVVNLFYVTEHHLSIERMGHPKTFYYMDGKNKVTDDDLLDRIKKIVIPPAWKNVRICKLENGHLQATGFDVLNRKQYRYHSLWSVVRNHTKFYRLLEFGKQLPAIRLQIEKDLSLPGFPREKVLAVVVSLMERTNIRVGNAFYEKLYGSFGLTTLKNRHVTLNGSKILFSFKGKKGVQHKVTLRSTKLSRIVKGCKEIPGKELFEYIDENECVHNVDSGMVNEYIHKISGGDFTSKDFRTWAGSVQALLAFKEVGCCETLTEIKSKIPAAFDIVAKHLGNTRAVCKKYYVHPLIPKLYEENKLDKYINQLDAIEDDDNKSGLTSEEKVLMKILEHV